MKKQYKHKLSEEIIHEIMEISRALPPMVKTDKNGNPIYVQSLVDGSKLKKTDLKDGSKPIAGLTYRINEVIWINHANELIEAFKTGGWKQVHAYSQAVQEQKKAAKKRALEKNSWITQVRKAFKEFFNSKAA